MNGKRLPVGTPVMIVLTDFETMRAKISTGRIVKHLRKGMCAVERKKGVTQEFREADLLSLEEINGMFAWFRQEPSAAETGQS